MGIVFNKKIGKSYKTTNNLFNAFSQRKPLIVLTRQNRIFLQSLGLRLKI